MPVVVPYRSNRPLKGRRLGRLGLVNEATFTSGSTAGAAAAGASAGASVGSVIPGVGTAIGAIVGAIGGTLANLFSSAPNTAAHLPWATALVNTLSQFGSTSGVGRQLPINQDGPSVYGITQMLEGLLATGAWMAWDTSLISSYDVCAHWAMAFTSSCQTVVQAICSHPVGPVTVSLNDSPGDTNTGAFNFTFMNPGPNASSDTISANIIMGGQGMVYTMLSHTGATPAQVTNAQNNAGAQKVFGLMVDFYLGQYAPQPVAAPVQQSAPVTTQSIVTPVTTAPGSATTTSGVGSPVADPETDALIQQLMAQGASQSAAMTAALQALASQGVNTQLPEVQAAVQNSAANAGGLLAGISPTTLLIIGGVIVAVVLMSRRSSSPASAAS